MIRPTDPGSYMPNPATANTALVFDVQRFSLHDGPGIRTTVFFKGCPLRCGWCQNPESHKIRPEMAFFAEHCRRCHLCRLSCPRGAILEGEKQRIDYSRCDACGLCARACQHRALRVVGEAWTASPLAREVLKDKDFYIDSEGGVTLSGGEPMMQVRFLEKFLPLLKSHGIHVNLETCGMFNWPDMESILPSLDLIYYDLKLMDTRAHKKYTGQGNETILDNFARLAETFHHLQPRMPVIPGINDGRDNIRATAMFLRKNRRATLHCLRYHRLGEAKLGRINTPLKPMNLPDLAPENLDTLKAFFEKEGVSVVVYD